MFGNIFSKEKVDEDIERFRRSISQPGVPDFIVEKKEEPKERASDIKDDEELGLSDFFGFWGIALRVVLPWALTFTGLLALVTFLLFQWLS